MSINEFFMHNFRKHIEAINDEYTRVCEENASLRQRMQEWRKDEEIQKLEVENTRLRCLSLHVMSEKEREDDQAFRHAHYESCHNGNDYEYELIGTGIGTVIKIRCPVCGEHKDITDISNW